MKFPERILRVKAESSEDYERWFTAIKDAQKAKQEGTGMPKSKQLDSMRAVSCT